MKVLYLGCYKDGTGWGYAAQGYILALDAAGVDVVPRAIKLNEVEGEVPERILELEGGSDKDCDVVIQHILPHYMDYNGSFDKNIALYVTETSHFNNTSWPERINLMDEAWVPNNQMLDSASNSNVCVPMHVLPHACDTERYQKEYEPLEIPGLEDKFSFYFIGEINRRKNINTIVKAFHLEFGREEDVELVLKAHLPGQSVAASEQHLSLMCNQIKDGLKLYPDGSLYHKEIFICQYLTDENIMRLHAACDCFVSATYGEAWGIPVFDAMAMGNTPICTDTGGPRDFMSGDEGWLVYSKPEACFGMIDTFEEMYVGNEYWDSIDVEELRRTMRMAFELSDERRKEKRNAGIAKAYEYSHLAVGLEMKKVLEGEKGSFLVSNSDTIHGQHSIEELIK